MPATPHHELSRAGAALLCLLAAGCSQMAVRGNMGASAPALMDGGQAHIRGVSDPNAPFTLIERTKAVRVDSVSAVSGMAETPSGTCQASILQVYETAASMDGDARVVRLALKNRGESTCWISGFPAIKLEDEKGMVIANVAIHQTGRASLTGTVTAPDQVAALPLKAMHVVLRPAGEASFEIGWSSGDQCPLVSRFKVELPQTPNESGATSALSGMFTINRALNVCGGELQVTALAMSGAT